LSPADGARARELTDQSKPPIQGRYLGRDEILSGAFETLLSEHHRNVRITPVEERMAIKRALLAELPAGHDPWVFAYGSLIWNPAFEYEERRLGTVHGYHREFCFWTMVGRGSSDLPGLMLGLEPGGSCLGILFRVARPRAEEELYSVFRRELMTSSYHARWVHARTEEGRVRAIAFIANRTHPFYCGRQPLATIARHVGGAQGRVGACVDYLVNTVRQLEAAGITDRHLTRVLRLVERAAST
jgi:cation transport protein ChaC